MPIKIVNPSIEPVPNSQGVEGHGEGIIISNDLPYFYHVGKRIPKNRVAVLRNETMYCGRRSGDVSYIAVVYSEKYNGFVLLRSPYGSIRKYMMQYHGKTNEEIVQEAETFHNRIDSIDVSEYEF